MKLSIRRLRQAEEVLVMRGKAGLRAEIGIQGKEVVAATERRGIRAETQAEVVAGMEKAEAVAGMEKAEVVAGMGKSRAEVERNKLR
jgi:hypothetical protein